MELGTRLARQEARLDELVRALGLEWTDPDDPRVAALGERQPHYPQYHRIGHKRQLAVRELTGKRAPVEQHYRLVVRALVADDDPSSPRWLAAVLVAAVGRRRVQESLLRAVEEGDPYQQVCAVGAWRWVQSPLDDASGERFAAARRDALTKCQDPWAREQLTAADTR
ncbi:hypothetical protein [Kitasatospora sp. GP82]|uniref:hypothetical protein n=1 Tax=Kitasatospora sp. GP82 TaxID=3035089 RepID=UPI002472EE28|nr:hypothetical protein [Kitasatospora sp. GP82]MDH6127103.1 hypothetical protein [Kitasatospora sp. GP82]